MEAAGDRKAGECIRGRGVSKTVRTRQDVTTNDGGGVPCVRFLDDADALETIRCISEAPPTLSRGAELLQKSDRAARAARRAAETPPPRGSSPDSDAASSADESDSALRQLDSAQLEDGGAVRGSAVFGFQRRHRRSHFRRVAEQFAESSPAKAPAHETLPATPKRGTPGRPATAGSSRLGIRRTPATPTGGGASAETRRTPTGGAPAEAQHTPRGAVANTPQTPRGGAGRTPANTPQTPRGGAGRTPAKTPQTPRGGAGRTPAKTPQAVRRQVKLRLSKLKQEDIAVSDDDDDSDVSPLEESSSEDEYEDENGLEENEDEEDDEEPTRTASPVAMRPRRGAARARPDPEPPAAGAEDYFSLHSAAGVTSNHTLSRLTEPRLSGAALRSLLGGRPPDHAAERAALLTDIELMFPHWMAVLSHGFNVLLHGLGSKRDVLERLRHDQLRDRLHVVVNGFHPSVTPRALLQTLLEDALDVAAPPGKLDAQLEAVLRRFSGPGADRLFLIVHSLDGPMMRGERMQQMMARLAQAPRVHLLASVDHINAPLVWDQHKLAKFNFLWFDATTLLPYAEETSYENSLLVRQTADLALSSLRHVFKSLTPNARGIFILLAKNQVECAGDRTFEGMALSVLYQRCRDAFLVSSQVALRAQLTEFRDHKLIRSRQAHDGVEQLTVPLEGALIAEFLASCDDS